jgi:hypothetical protein
MTIMPSLVKINLDISMERKEHMQKYKGKSSSVTQAVAYSVGSAIHITPYPFFPQQVKPKEYQGLKCMERCVHFPIRPRSVTFRQSPLPYDFDKNG